MSVDFHSSDFEAFIVIPDNEKQSIVNSKPIHDTTFSTGKGNVYCKEQMLKKDLFVLDSYYKMEQDVRIIGEGESDLLEIQFNLSKHDIFYQNARNIDIFAPAGSGNIAYLPTEENKAKIFFKKDISYNTFDIHLPINFFDAYEGESKLVDTFIQKVKSHAEASLIPQGVAINSSIYTVIQDIKRCVYEGLTRKIYIEAKVYELIALVHSCVENYNKVDCKLTQADQEKIREAALIIQNNLEQPCSIIDLARMVGVNQTKLKLGFKSIFGNTVFGYLQDIRMHKAKRYLLDKELSIQDIGTMLGYQNVSNFSSAFKKIHGYSPMKMRQQQSIK